MKYHDHSRYQGKTRPKSLCERCWEIFVVMNGDSPEYIANRVVSALRAESRKEQEYRIGG